MTIIFWFVGLLAWLLSNQDSILNIHLVEAG